MREPQPPKRRKRRNKRKHNKRVPQHLKDRARQMVNDALDAEATRAEMRVRGSDVPITTNIMGLSFDDWVDGLRELRETTAAS